MKLLINLIIVETLELTIFLTAVRSVKGKNYRAGSPLYSIDYTIVTIVYCNSVKK